ncbi:NAD-dependent epimerase/dehydratase family protein [Streptomyces sp. NPDC058221]|uniref:NAD-dependent epimerase/dehydratase family protein n=1 Tax=Streptomyces sp. NPDC058221 TaxID=3346388 RepID=UPI0036EC42E6
MTTRILITGATGFVGSRVVAAARATPGLGLRTMIHRTEPAESAQGTDGSGFEKVYGDLADPGTLRGSCEGVDAVIHCASHIGSGEQAARTVNDHGTRALVDEAVRSGVGRIVQLSTASVYGRGPFNALRPGTAEPAPASVTSLTRAAAEQHVLAAGGTVLRPHLVHGEGDRWAIPGLVSLLRYLSAGPAGCEARHSMIDVDTLGRALLGAALSPKRPTGVYHVNHPDPVSCSDLLSTVLSELSLPWAGTEIGMDEARARLASVPYAKHHFEMLTVDHWFADDRVWADFDCPPGPDFRTSFAEHAPWYRKFLSR